jgi:hypothetical protein
VNDGHFGYFTKSITKKPWAQHANNVKGNQEAMLEDVFNF